MEPPKSALQALKLALQAKGQFEIVSVVEKPNQLHIMGRVPTDKGPTALARWHRLIVLLDGVTQTQEKWSVDISKKYFARDGEPLYSWRLIFQGPLLKELYMSIVKYINGPVSVEELKEFPLTGASSDRNSLVRGKGATPRGAG